MTNFGKLKKTYLANTNLLYALSESKPDIGNLRETFFLSQMQVSQKVFASKVFYFFIDGETFEVGEKSKSKKQLAEVKDGFVVKDVIEFGYGNVLPRLVFWNELLGWQAYQNKSHSNLFQKHRDNLSVFCIFAVPKKQVLGELRDAIRDNDLIMD